MAFNTYFPIPDFRSCIYKYLDLRDVIKLNSLNRNCYYLTLGDVAAASNTYSDYIDNITKLLLFQKNVEIVRFLEKFGHIIDGTTIFHVSTFPTLNKITNKINSYVRCIPSSLSLPLFHPLGTQENVKPVIRTLNEERLTKLLDNLEHPEIKQRMLDYLT